MKKFLFVISLCLSACSLEDNLPLTETTQPNISTDTFHIDSTPLIKKVYRTELKLPEFSDSEMVNDVYTLQRQKHLNRSQGDIFQQNEQYKHLKRLRERNAVHGIEQHFPEEKYIGSKDMIDRRENEPKSIIQRSDFKRVESNKTWEMHKIEEQSLYSGERTKHIKGKISWE